MVFQLLKASYTKIKSALKKVRSAFGDQFLSLLTGKMDESTLDKLEQLFYEADFGVSTASEMTAFVRELHKNHPSYKAEDFLKAVETRLIDSLSNYNSSLSLSDESKKPSVILIVGVNGNGKTTSVAKLSSLFVQNNKKVIVGAADTFRAAAIDQLETWAKKIGVDIVKSNPKSDPAAVAFDAVQAAKARNCDVVLIDTAGRLHTKTALMQELEKIKRSCQKASGHPIDEILLVLDATTGQNAIDQAKHFHQFTPLTGIILTKMDGTAKGGIVFAIQKELGVPIKFIGTGEQIDDLQPFDAKLFVSSLFA